MRGSPVSDRSHFQVLPPERTTEDRQGTHRHLGRVRARPQPLAEGRIAGVVAQATAEDVRIVRPGQVAGPPAGDPGVEGDGDGPEAGGLGAVHQARGHLPVRRRVQLEGARRAAAFRRRFFHRIRRQATGEERNTGPRGGPRTRHVAVTALSTHPDHPDRRHEHGRGQPHTEQLDRHVPLGRRHQHARVQTPALERRAIGSLRVLVTGANTGHIPPPRPSAASRPTPSPEAPGTSSGTGADGRAALAAQFVLV